MVIGHIIKRLLTYLKSLMGGSKEKVQNSDTCYRLALFMYIVFTDLNRYEGGMDSMNWRFIYRFMYSKVEEKVIVNDSV